MDDRDTKREGMMHVILNSKWILTPPILSGIFASKQTLDRDETL
jgi:hypothetical protein